VGSGSSDTKGGPAAAGCISSAITAPATVEQASRHEAGRIIIIIIIIIEKSRFSSDPCSICYIVTFRVPFHYMGNFA